VAVHGGRLFDGTGAAPIEDGVVLIEGNRIVAAGAAGDVAIPDNAATVDADGGLIMPGVIDNHTHLAAGWREVVGDHLTPWLEAGVTTLVDVGFPRDGVTLPGGLVVDDSVGLLRTLIAGLSEHPPRAYLAGPILTAPHGYPETRGGLDGLAAQGVAGPDDARARVARLIDEQGADLIKVAIEAGFDQDYDDDGWPVLDPETLAAIAEAAHERDTTVRAHVTQEGELRAALQAGFDVAAHTPIEPLSDEILREAAEAGMIFVTTANIWGPGGSQNAAENAARYAEMGGRVTLGTDFPFQEGSEMPVAEMQLLVDAGMTPTEVLVAATKHGAEALGLGDELGTLAPGKLADVIVVDGDPLSDIADMGNVTVVIRDGEVIVGDVVQPPPVTPPAPPGPTATAVSLPKTGGGSDNEGQYIWPAVAALMLAALVGGAVLVARRH
jgi:imidazolonepropionase-like amidohydrolase